jgi:hypothetical protein
MARIAPLRGSRTIADADRTPLGGHRSNCRLTMRFISTNWGADGRLVAGC